MKTFILALSLIAAGSMAHAANNVTCNQTRRDYSALTVSEGDVRAYPGASSQKRIVIRFINPGVISFFKNQGFTLPFDETRGITALEASISVFQQVNTPYQYSVSDASNTTWTIRREGNGLKVIANNYSSGASANWFFESCQFD